MSLSAKCSSATRVSSGVAKRGVNERIELASMVLIFQRFGAQRSGTSLFFVLFFLGKKHPGKCSDDLFETKYCYG